jgi:hypothetical protein
MTDAKAEIVVDGERAHARRITGTKIAIDVFLAEARIFEGAERDLGVELGDRLVRGIPGGMLIGPDDICLSFDAHVSSSMLGVRLGSRFSACQGRAWMPLLRLRLPGGEIGRLVEVAKRGDEAHPVGGKAGEQGAQSIGMRPGHLPEGLWRTAARGEADEPKPAIQSGSHHDFGPPPQRAGGLVEMAGSKIGNVCSHQMDPPARKAADEAMETGAEIASALIEAGQGERQGEPGAIGGESEEGEEARIAPEPADEPHQQSPVKAEGGPFADRPGEAALDRAAAGSARDDDDEFPPAGEGREGAGITGSAHARFPR